MPAPTLGELESVSDSLRAALSGDTAVPEGGAGEAEPLEPAAPAGSEPVEPPPTSKVQNRAPDGKYAAGHREAEPAAPAAPEQEPVEPPPNWKLEQQERFRKFSPADQRFLLDMVGSIQKAPDHYAGLESVINEERINTWSRLGQTPAAAISQLLAISDFAEHRPVDFIKWFAAQRGINLGQQQQEAPKSALEGIDPNDPINKDPVFQALKSEITTLRENLGKVTGVIDQSSQAAQQRQQLEARAARAQAHQQLTEFSTAKDASGNVKHPYFDEVRHLMGSFIDPRLGDKAAANLEQAYEMACRAHPEVSRKIAAAAQAAAERDRRRQEQEKAAKAKAAGASVTGGAGGEKPQAATGDLRADLRAAFQERGLFGTSPNLI